MGTKQADEFEREMVALEAELKRLEAEYNMFFAGRLPRLPWETRARVEAAVKRWDRTYIQNTAQRFRFGTLQARFAAFVELWERHLKAREEGRPGPTRARAGSAPPQAQAPAARERGGIVHVARVRDADQDAQGVRELYERLSEARRGAGEQPVPFDRFQQLVRAQVQKLGAGTEFRVAVKDGKVTLTAAKPPKSDG
ncbi:MAG: hypothetical protein AB1635_14985 [Acidobacteriota bacterium]